MENGALIALLNNGDFQCGPPGLREDEVIQQCSMLEGPAQNKEFTMAASAVHSNQGGSLWRIGNETYAQGCF